MAQNKGFGFGLGKIKELQEAFKKAQQVQEGAKALQDELERMEIEGVSENGLVKVYMSGNQEPLRIAIAPELLGQGTETVEMTIADAMKAAYRESTETMRSKMEELTSGLDLPGCRTAPVTPILKLSELSEAQLARLLRRSEIDIDSALAVAQTVIDRVKAEGDAGVLHYARTFDYPDATLDSLRVTDQEFEQAEAQLAPDLRRAVEHSLRNIQRVHEGQMPPPIHLAEIEPGVLAGEKITPIPRVGLYVPRGKGAFPSMMLMLAAPARVAGVKSIAVCTPPDRQGQVEPVSLVAARLAGVTEVYKLGGVQALAALGLGTALVPKVDKLIGPCSAYGAAAKRILFGSVDVGLPAGPSESIILADESADPQLAALDLLIEAEHGPDSAALLVTHSGELAQAAQGHVESYLQQLPPWRRQFCQEGLANYGGILLTPDLTASLDFINAYAPEHLQLLVADPLALLGKIDNAGEILLGPYTPSSAATYAIGVNAVLPTGGFARSYSAVSVFDFLKRSTLAYLTPEGFNRIKDTVTALADYEDFPAHSLAIRERERLWGL